VRKKNRGKTVHVFGEMANSTKEYGKVERFKEGDGPWLKATSIQESGLILNDLQRNDLKRRVGQRSKRRSTKRSCASSAKVDSRIRRGGEPTSRKGPGGGRRDLQAVPRKQGYSSRFPLSRPFVTGVRRIKMNAGLRRVEGEQQSRRGRVISNSSAEVRRQHLKKSAEVWKRHKKRGDREGKITSG